MNIPKAAYSFWITAVAILAIALINYAANGETVVDVNVYDVYYVIPHYLVSIVLALAYLIAGFIYFALNRLKINTLDLLTRLHAIITIGAVPAYYIIVPLTGLTDTLLTDNATYAAAAILLAALMGQMLFLLNMLISLWRSTIKTKTA